MDPIGALAELIASFLQGDGLEQIRLILQIVVYGIIALLVFFIRPILLRIPYVRRVYQDNEKLVGQYVQIIREDDERRYSILRIRYNKTHQNYTLQGNQYNVKGERAIDFSSGHVALRAGPVKFFEFLWRAEDLEEKEFFDGYTQMKLDDFNDSSLFEGRGFFITFHNQPIRYNLQFFKITAARIDILKQKYESEFQIPLNDETRKDFVVALHNAMAEHPDEDPI